MPNRVAVPGTAYRCQSCGNAGYTQSLSYSAVCSCGGPRQSVVLQPNPRARVHRDSLPDAALVAAYRTLGAAKA